MDQHPWNQVQYPQSLFCNHCFHKLQHSQPLSPLEIHPPSFFIEVDAFIWDWNGFPLRRVTAPGMTVLVPAHCHRSLLLHEGYCPSGKTLSPGECFLGCEQLRACYCMRIFFFSGGTFHGSLACKKFPGWGEQFAGIVSLLGKYSFCWVYFCFCFLASLCLLYSCHKKEISQGKTQA